MGVCSCEANAQRRRTVKTRGAGRGLPAVHLSICSLKAAEADRVPPAGARRIRLLGGERLASAHASNVPSDHPPCPDETRHTQTRTCVIINKHGLAEFMCWLTCSVHIFGGVVRQGRYVPRIHITFCRKLAIREIVELLCQHDRADFSL